MTPIGILASLFAIIGSMAMDRGDIGSLFKLSSMIIVVGGSMGAAMAGFGLRQLRPLPKALLIVFKPNKGPKTRETIETLLAMAKEARSNPLILEELQTDDAFMKKGIQLIISTSDSERVRVLLVAEIDGLRDRHRTATKFFSDMAGYSPTFGIIGTVIGLIGVLGQLSEPDKLGSHIATAFTATLWGVLLANSVWLPISNKLHRLTEEEITYREMVVVGLLTMQLNASTRELKDRLEAYLAPSEREEVAPRPAVEDSEAAA
ncbi:MAG TPA: MotA/TolQ/ExbB proton channel family protein [Candidatus Paceibacterota bacterium]|nr:MotA/TolQ/ExbB proton channel family protein [Candidatus Paceibacterota bacterium]